MTAVLLVALLGVIVAVAAIRTSLARRRNQLGGPAPADSLGVRPPPTTTPPTIATPGRPHEQPGTAGIFAPPAAGADASGVDRPVVEHHADLADLVRPVELPGDLNLYTFGLATSEMRTRLVLTSVASTADIRTRLLDAVTAADYDISGDGLAMVASSGQGSFSITLHPPVDPATVKVERRRSRKKAPDPLRPDFPGAPFTATVIELRSSSPERTDPGGWT